MINLTCADYIPRPSPPYIISKGSTWIQLGWDQDCDGGYQIHSYDLRMKQSLSYYYTTVATTSDTVFIVEDLSPNTEYLFVLSGYSEYAGKYGRTSDNASVTTLPTGTGNINLLLVLISIPKDLPKETFNSGY